MSALTVAIFAAGWVLVRWQPKTAATLAVIGLLFFGLLGIWWGLQWIVTGGQGYRTVGMPSFYGAVYGAVLVQRRHRGTARRRPGRFPSRSRCPARSPTPAVGRRLGDGGAGAGARLAVDRLTRDPQRRDGGGSRRAAPHRARPARRRAGPARRGRHVPTRGGAVDARLNPEAALALVAEARETSSRALDDLRDLVRGIYPPVLADRGLPTRSVPWPWTPRWPWTRTSRSPGDRPCRSRRRSTSRIAEALTNAVRHSGADTVQIGIGYADGMLRATVVDDGQGGADPSRARAWPASSAAWPRSTASWR